MALPVREMTLTEAVDTTRSGSAWYFDSSGVFQEESTSDVARIDYDPNGGARLGLMSEGQSTNEIGQSTPSTTSGWNAANCSTPGTGDSTFATNIPLVEIVEDTANARHRIFRSISVSADVYTLSAYVKAGARTHIRLQAVNASVNMRADADLGAGTSTFIGGTGRIDDVGGGVYRLQVTSSIAMAAGSVVIYVEMQDSQGGAAYAGDGTSNVFAGGVQLEALPGASSLIPCAGSAVTRAAETHELVSLDPWYRASGYSVAAQYAPAFTPATATFQALASLDDGSADNRLELRHSPSRAGQAFIQRGGSTVANISRGTPVDRATSAKMAVRVAPSNFAISVEGGAVDTDTTGNVPEPATVFRLGIGAPNANPFYGWIQDIKYTTTLLSDAELATESGTTV